MSFLAFVDSAFLLNAGLLMVAGFLLWELPRSLKLLDRELEAVIYPASGRVFDICLFVIGLLAYVIYLLQQNAVVNAIRMPTFSLAFAIIYISAPVLVFLSFFSRIVKLFDQHQSLSVFSTSFVFGLFRTIFYTTFLLIFLAIAMFFFVDFYH